MGLPPRLHFTQNSRLDLNIRSKNIGGSTFPACLPAPGCLPHMLHHGGAIVAEIWLPVVNQPTQNSHILVIVVPTRNARYHWSTQAHGHDVLRHLSFRERTKKSLERHLTAMQGTTQSHNYTPMPETVVRGRTTR